MSKGGWTMLPSQFVDTIEDDLGVLVRDRAEQVVRDLVYFSPVRTGRFVGNMNFSVNRPDNSYDPELYDASRNDTFANARIAIAALRPGDTFYAVNTTPYGKYLEWGTTKMAPRRPFGRAFNNLREAG
ncbi:hypothetical protein C7446_2568 [Kushneria sinocarnis]|uniref:HK97 gp10 family phage protein n=2 Tax=Kushneria sinocarnis TaxID=595502 RepID=A0A420WUM6_9GAMM|nr:hypothetical protein C7446_2568 [Kushneria sinocarnis]